MTTAFELHSEDCSPTGHWDIADDANTIAEAAAEPRPWFMAISLGSRPRCFGCGGRMLPKVVVVQSAFAICERCATTDWSGWRPYWHAIGSLGSTLELSTSRGITFWTPPASLPDIDGYLRWLELWDTMHPDRPARRPTHHRHGMLHR